MKCIIILATIACVLSVTLASNKHKAEKAHSEVKTYVAENMSGVRMMRSNRSHLDCYNGFLPLINSLAVRAKEESYACVADADGKKDNELSKLDRSVMEAKVKQLTDSLTDCSTRDGLEYFVCLDRNAEANKQLLEAISNMAKQIVSQSTSVVAGIHSNEDSCIMRAIDQAKERSDAAFSHLKECIKGAEYPFTTEDYVSTTA